MIEIVVDRTDKLLHGREEENAVTICGLPVIEIIDYFFVARDDEKVLAGLRSAQYKDCAGCCA